MVAAEAELESTAKVGLVGRLIRSLLRPSRILLIGGGLACVAIAGTLSLTMWGSDGDSADTYPQAWELLKEAKFQESRAMATRLLIDHQTPAEIGEGAFLVGRALCGEAENEWNDTRRVGMYLIASRYLQEAYHNGFPEGHEDEGLYYLAMSTFESDRPTASLPFWSELEEKDPIPFRDETLDYLKRVYLIDRHLDESEGLRIVDAIAENPELTTDQREQLTPDRGKLLLRAGRFEEGLNAIKEIAPESPLRPSQRLLKVRLLLASAQVLEDREQRGESIGQSVEELYEQAVSELLGVEVSLMEDPQEGDLALFHLGQCYQRLGDLDQAEQLFGEIRRAHLDDSLGWAAAVEEAYKQFFQDFKPGTFKHECPETSAGHDGNVAWMIASCAPSRV